MTDRNGRKVELASRFGGKCSRCGYDRCSRALHFHHVDGRNGPGGKVDLREVDEFPERFQLVCANCHIEIHDEIDKSRRRYSMCARCGASFRIDRRSHQDVTRFCSRECYHSNRSIDVSSAGAVMKRVERKIDKTGDCWLWTGGVSGPGRTPVIGVTSESGQHTTITIRRFIYESLYGHKPNKNLFSSCRNSRCVRPDHWIT